MTAFVPTTPTRVSGLRTTISSTSTLSASPAAVTVSRPLPHAQPQRVSHTPSPPPPGVGGGPSRVLLWLHTDLRLEDNPALQAALDASSRPGGALVLVLVSPNASAQPAAAELSAQITSRGGSLLVVPGTPTHTLPELCDRLKLHAVFFNRSVARDAIKLECAVTNALQRADVRVEAYWGNVVMTPRREWLAGRDAPNAQMVRTVMAKEQIGVLTAPNQLPMPPTAAASIKQIALCKREGGGTSAAMKVLQTMRREEETLDLSAKADVAFLLKTHLDVGTVSPRMVALRVQQIMGSLRGRTFCELTWRAYESVVAHRSMGVTSVSTTVTA